MAHPGFGHLWQQPELSNVEVVIALDTSGLSTAADNATPVEDTSNHKVLRQFPGHNAILSSSRYFAAQALRWQSKAPNAERTSNAASSRNASDSTQQPAAKPQILITLPDASYEAAAMAVLQSLYLVKPVQDLLKDLTQQQQLHAAVLADMWEMPVVSSTAVKLLKAAARTSAGLNAAARDELLAMAAVPDCLRPLLQQALLSRFGDLEAVWADPARQKCLMKLPLHVMELLLSLNQLKVSSEDTVLCTTRAYADRLKKDGVDWKLLQDRLAPLVRCRHMSKFWLLASVLADDPAKELLGGLQKQLKHMLLLQQAGRGVELTAAYVSAGVPDAPASWLLPPRPGRKQASSVQVEWAVDVAAIKAAAQEAATAGKKVWIDGDHVSAPVMGICWLIYIECTPDTAAPDEGRSIDIGIYAFANNLPAGASCNATFSLECVGFSSPQTNEHRFRADQGVGFDPLGVMQGGWDNAVWAAEGLPASGQLVLKLTVSNVGQ